MSPPPETTGPVLDFLLTWAQERLGKPITADASFAEAGLDSFDIIALADALQAHLGDDDISLLTVIEHSGFQELADHLAPASGGGVQAFLVGWVSERLGKEVDPAATFAEVGLDSFDIIALADALQAHTGDDEVSLLTVIEHPSIAELAAHLGAGAAPEETAGPPPLTSRGPHARPVISCWQEAILAWEAPREPSSTWGTSLWVRLLGPLDTSRLQEAIEAVAQRQDALRQVFTRGQPAAAWCEPSAIRLQVQDLTGQPEDKAEELYRKISETPFPLDGAPLAQFHLLRRGPEDHSLIFNWHQLVHDGTGGDLVLKEVLELYAARSEGRTPDLPQLPITHSDYAAWEREWFEGAGAAQVSEARQRLAGMRPVALPPRPQGAPLTRAAGIQTLLGPDLVEPLVERAQAEGVPYFAAMTALVGILLGRWFDQDEVTVAVPTSTRTRPELRSLVGRFGAWVPLRISLCGDRTIRDLWAQVAEQSDQLHKAVPGTLLFERADVFNHPLMRVVVNAPSAASVTAEFPCPPGLQVQQERPYKSMTSPADLALLLVRLGNRVGVRMVGHEALIPEEEMATWVERVGFLVEAARPDMRLSDLRWPTP